VVNIPANVTELPTGAGAESGSGLPPGAFQLPNDARLKGYVGAGPPEGTGRHRYIFAVLTLAAEKIDREATPALLMFSLFSGTLGRAFLEGWFEVGPCLRHISEVRAGHRDHSGLSGWPRHRHERDCVCDEPLVRCVQRWMSTIVNVDGGQVLGVVDGRNSAAVGAGWLSRARPGGSASRVVAIDPSGVQEGGALGAVVTPLMAVQRARTPAMACRRSGL
jgi:hypothetical protein